MVPRLDTEVDVAANAVAVVLAKVRRGDAVLQLLFAYGRVLVHCPPFMSRLPTLFIDRLVRTVTVSHSRRSALTSV